MKHVAWTKRKSALTITLCAIIATSTIIILQNTKTTQAALIDPHPGLVGWWRFDEGSGTVAGDNSGNGNNGTINGATWVTGKYGQALSFNGAGNYVVIPSPSGGSLNPTPQISLEAWVKPTLAQAGQIVSKNGPYALQMDAGGTITLWIFAGSPPSWDYVTTIGTIPLNQWSQVVGIYNGANMQVYINGLFSNLKVHSKGGAMAQSSKSVYIGYGEPGFDQYFAGTIDEVRLYNRALSTVEIQADFQQKPDVSSNLLIKVPKGTTQIIITLSWQGTGTINATITSPTQTYTEDMISAYQKTTYATSGGTSNMLNVKRLSINVAALSADQSWNVSLAVYNVDFYQASVEIQK